MSNWVSTPTGLTTSGTIAVTSSANNAIDVAGGVQAGSGNVQIVDATGRIPAITSTQFADLSGAALTNIPETAIADGGIFARVAANETITGTWTFTGVPTSIFASGNAVFTSDSTEANALVLIGRPLDSASIILFRDSLNASTYASIHIDPPNANMRLSAGTPAVPVLDLTSSAMIPQVRINSSAAQPGFLATRSTNVAGNQTLVFDSEIFDESSAYNATTGVFTAQVTGRYHFDIAVSCGDFSDVDSLIVTLVTSARSFRVARPTQAIDAIGQTLSMSMVTDLSVGQTAHVITNVAFAEVAGSTSPYETWFSARLVV